MKTAAEYETEIKTLRKQLADVIADTKKLRRELRHLDQISGNVICTSPHAKAVAKQLRKRMKDAGRIDVKITKAIMAQARL